MNNIQRISSEQSKLLRSAVRIQILHLMKERPRSAKQVADILGRSPGSIHYHVQKLFAGGLLALDSTAQVNGITEKFYSANATLFEPELLDGSLFGRLLTWMLFSPEELEEFKSDLLRLVQTWEARQSSVPVTERKEVLVQFFLQEAPKVKQRNSDRDSEQEVQHDDVQDE